MEIKLSENSNFRVSNSSRRSLLWIDDDGSVSLNGIRTLVLTVDEYTFSDYQGVLSLEEYEDNFGINLADALGLEQVQNEEFPNGATVAYFPEDTRIALRIYTDGSYNMPGCAEINKISNDEDGRLHLCYNCGEKTIGLSISLSESNVRIAYA